MAAVRLGNRISYNGGSIGEQQLPKGSCNFRDLSIGHKAPTCGCKRFWLNDTHLSGGIERGWCFCGHHACFHSASSQQQSTLGLDGHVAAEVERETLQGPASQTQPAGLGIRPGPSAQSQSINTRIWDALNTFARQQDDGPASSTTSKLPSTACPSIAGDPRLSPSWMLTEQVPQARSMGPPINIPPVCQAITNSEEYSATEIATPSLNGTPDLGGPIHSVSQMQALKADTTPVRLDQSHCQTKQAQATMDDTNELKFNPTVAQPRSSLPPPTLSLPEMQNLLHALGRRLEVFESLSFSNVPIEELQERLEHFDGRILDLEHWRMSTEQRQQSPEPEKIRKGRKRRLLPTETSSFASDGSFDSAAAAHTEAAVLATLAANAETVPRIVGLEARVADLENAALPSFARPWDVQVVLLPWGRDLRGVWFSTLDAPQESLKSSSQMQEEWNGPQSNPTLSFRSCASGKWTTESIQAWAEEAQDWMSPKACGPSGIVFQRLASRGLVQNVTLASGSSRHILDVISNTFSSILPESETSNSHQAERYQALRESFIPLRKVPKSTRLRFLSPAEMVTSASWTAGFLGSGVLMKVSNGPRRLYLTTPDAYLQSHEHGWSWQKLRQLPMYTKGEDETSGAALAEMEACWAYNDRLDLPASSHVPFASCNSQESQWHDQNREKLHEMGTETDQRVLPPMSPHSDARSADQRAVSLPNSSCAVEQAKEGLPKRRVASFETCGVVSLDAEQATVNPPAKRQCTSTSPEAERRGVGFTPRWSREPPSPFTSEHTGEVFSQGAASRMRGTTPFAYATPHSNSNHFLCTEFPGADNDTEADTDMAPPQSAQDEDEWHGVADHVEQMAIPPSSGA